MSRHLPLAQTNVTCISLKCKNIVQKCTFKPYTCNLKCQFVIELCVWSCKNVLWIEHSFIFTVESQAINMGLFLNLHWCYVIDKGCFTPTIYQFLDKSRSILLQRDPKLVRFPLEIHVNLGASVELLAYTQEKTILSRNVKNWFLRNTTLMVHLAEPCWVISFNFIYLLWF